jgi:hypothetical protein
MYLRVCGQLLKEFFDFWTRMAKPEEGEKNEKVDMLSIWNVDQAGASAAIKKKIASQPGICTKKKTLRGLQSHIERRLWKNDAPESSEVNDLDGLPGMAEECFDVFAGPVPSRRKHLYVRGDIRDSVYPEEIIELRNPSKSEPKVTVAQMKAIFPPDRDSDVKSIRGEPVWVTQPWEPIADLLMTRSSAK